MCLTEAARRHRPRPAPHPRRAGRRRQLPDHRHEDLHHRRRARPDRDIVHLVLARLPDAPAGTRGHLALRRAQAARRARRRAGRAKRRRRAARSSTRWASAPRPPAARTSTGAVGELVGEPHRGMRAMFTMMNAARLGVGIQGLGVGEAAYQCGARLRPRAAARAARSAARRARISRPTRSSSTPTCAARCCACASQIEGGRALALWVAAEIDSRSTIPTRRAPGGRRPGRADDADREGRAAPTSAPRPPTSRSGSSAATATSASRAWSSSCATRASRQIYEGTNGVQALDLVGRKLPEGAGPAAAPLLPPRRWSCSPRRPADRAPGRLRGAGPRRARSGCSDTTLWLAEQRAAPTARRPAPRRPTTCGCSPSRRSARCGCGWPGGGSPATSEFGAEKLATARFYAAGCCRRRPRWPRSCSRERQ